jgi:hypothetical protein
VKFYVIKNASKKVVALIFHDYVTSQYSVHTKSVAFKRSFTNFCESTTKKFFKEKDASGSERLMMVDFNKSNYGWMMFVLSKMCKGGKWNLDESGDIDNNPIDIDKTVSDYLGI